MLGCCQVIISNGNFPGGMSALEGSGDNKDTAHLIVVAGDDNFPFIRAAIGTYPMRDDWSLTVGAGGMCRRRQ